MACADGDDATGAIRAHRRTRCHTRDPRTGARKARARCGWIAARIAGALAHGAPGLRAEHTGIAPARRPAQPWSAPRSGSKLDGGALLRSDAASLPRSLVCDPVEPGAGTARARGHGHQLESVSLELRSHARVSVEPPNASSAARRTGGRALSRYSKTLTAVPTRTIDTMAAKPFVETKRGEGSRHDRSTLFIDTCPPKGYRIIHPDARERQGLS
jgi:hypothetical protein